jgi:rhodanese-related sulfurtransferase
MSWDQLSAFVQSTPLLSLAFAGLTVAVVVSEVRHRLSGIRGVSPAQATLMVNREDALLVDVSPAADFAKAHILGSISAPLTELAPDKHKLLSKTSRDRPVVVVCRAGLSARSAAALLKKAGFTNVSVLEGGISAWRQADLPLAKGR